ncbi:MAG: 3'(2'),5'-bisphosphate nucleotidase CysQ [Planctomycetes bacterium]|nr:3'(2'),5'-bisphosphate nucleotidase CysQ [Planctomycetota bacterium]MCB9911955.1 3'(2'),5'-bisphosphate nucleotidase CysQ [Planctomycetota bacterium]HPF15184.1 3'(2'),5'-bisphosphate nucleotidase CysQ [Planctomycetota bacterium]HRV80400.1 3'(2'),5'-bisphosphate nucleotidase CysQ [Planctomycetota bacterium]
MDPQSPQIAASIAADLDFAILAAGTAGRRALALRQSGRWHDEILGDVGDQTCDAWIQGMLLGRYPDDGVLSEETQDSPRRLETPRTWVIDPLDGTKEYRTGRDDWAVHVALTEGGQCVLGAVALPAQGRVLWGIARPGFESAGVEGSGGLRSGADPQDGPLRIAVSRSHTPPWVETLASELGAQLVRAGSVGNKVALLLSGEADLYAHKVGLKEWDTCAPECVARALGWHVSRLDGSPQRYNQADPRNGELLVCRPQDRERVLAALQTSGALSS